MLQPALTAQAISYFVGTKASISRLLQIGRAEPALSQHANAGVTDCATDLWPTDRSRPISGRRTPIREPPR